MKNPLIGGVRFYQRFISPGLPAEENTDDKANK